MKDSIIVVADDVMRGALVWQPLTDAGYSVVRLPAATLAFDLIEGAWPSLIVLDVVSLDRASLEFICTLRHTVGSTGMWIMVLSAPLAEAERLAAWELGVDQLLDKPVSSRELVAHVQALLRRLPGNSRRGAVVPEREEGSFNAHGAGAGGALVGTPGGRDGLAVRMVDSTRRAWLANVWYRWCLSLRNAE